MLKKRRNYHGIIDTKEKVLYVGVLIVFLLGALLWYNYIHRPPEFTAQGVFEQTFIEPVSSVTDLQGGNNPNYGFDYWIKFGSPTPIHLRESSEFKPSVAEVGRRWFAEKYKNDPTLNDAAVNYEYLENTRHDVGKVVHQWFLINKKRHFYFYRNWGM